MMYVEGFALDEFASGHIGLRPKISQSIGLLLDRGIEKDLQLRHLQAAKKKEAALLAALKISSQAMKPDGRHAA